MQGLSSILSLLLERVQKFNNKRARMLDSIYHYYDIHITLKSHFCPKNLAILLLCMQCCYGRHNVSPKSINS